MDSLGKKEILGSIVELNPMLKEKSLTLNRIKGVVTSGKDPT